MEKPLHLPEMSIHYVYHPAHRISQREALSLQRWKSALTQGWHELANHT